MTPEQRNFNFVQSCLRMVIKHVFGILKGRFRLLKYIDTLQIKDTAYIIVAACALHNLCLVSGDDLDYYEEEPEVNREDN